MGHSPTMTTEHHTHVFERYEGQPKQPMETLISAAKSVRKVSDRSLALVHPGLGRVGEQ